MTQHFTEKDFANMGNLRIEGDTFGDRLSNSISFLTDFAGFGIKRGVDSIQEIIKFASPSVQQSLDQSGIKLGNDSNFNEPFDESQDPEFTEQPTPP